MTIRVQVRDGQLRRVAELDDYSDLSATVRSCDVGTWKVTCPANHPAALALTYRGGLVIERNGQPFTAGPVTRLEVGSRRLTRGRVVETLTASGVDDNAHLARRLALPGPLGTPQDYDDHSGPVESVLRGFVDRNAGPGALPARRVRGLVLDDDLGRGPGVRGRPDRYDQLLAFLRETALGAGVGFRVVQADRALVFQVYVPTDRSRTVVLGLDRSNLSAYSYVTTAPKANHLYVAGTGDLAARLIVEREDPGSVDAFDRVEAFVDQNNVDDPALLAQKGDEQLVEQAANSGLTLTPIDAPGSLVGVDYFLDDVVAVRLTGGATITDRVAQLDLAVKAGRESLTPTVASDGANLTGLNLVQTLRQLGRRLTRVEGRS